WERSLKGRSTYPKIVRTSITDMPTDDLPVEGCEQYVTSVINYDGELSDVFIKWSIDDLSFDQYLDMDQVAGDTFATDCPLPDFSAGSKVYFKVYAVGDDNDTTLTYKYMYEIRPLAYCAASGDNSSAVGINEVSFADISKNSTKTGSYTNYTDSDTAYVYQSSFYNLHMQVSSADANSTTYAMAWIDWNRDGDFDDLGEAYPMGVATGAVDQPTDITPIEIFIPTDAHLGKTVMRVAAKDGSAPTTCETNYDGEVEEYSLFIKPQMQLDYELSHSTICVNTPLQFDYKGTKLDSLHWSIWKEEGGQTTSYTAKEWEGSVSIDEAGIYSLALIGYEGGTVNSLIDSNAIEVIGPDNRIALIDSRTLTARETNATYKWYNCDTQQIIPGETSQIFTPSASGHYAVILSTSHGCVDTSTCYNYATSRTQNYTKSAEQSMYSFAQLFPNPNKGSFFLQLDRLQKALHVVVYDISGRNVFESNYQDQKQIEINLEVPPGLYYVALANDQGQEMTITIDVE
ncbi:MAG: GEVED domain-containing protein, partial [Bacteroidota bacterium]